MATDLIPELTVIKMSLDRDQRRRDADVKTSSETKSPELCQLSPPGPVNVS